MASLIRDRGCSFGFSEQLAPQTRPGPPVSRPRPKLKGDVPESAALVQIGACRCLALHPRPTAAMLVRYRDGHGAVRPCRANQKSPGHRVYSDPLPGLFLVCRPVGSRSAFPGLAPKGDTCVSNPSVTPVATGTTSVFHRDDLNDPVIRFQHAVDVDLQVRDLERGVQRLARLLTPPVSSSAARRPSRRTTWWASA